MRKFIFQISPFLAVWLGSVTGVMLSHSKLRFTEVPAGAWALIATNIAYFVIVGFKMGWYAHELHVKKTEP